MKQSPAFSVSSTAHTSKSNKDATLLSLDKLPMIMKGYYMERIQELQGSLKQLNILEDARLISTVCHEIIRAQQKIGRLNVTIGQMA